MLDDEEEINEKYGKKFLQLILSGKDPAFTEQKNLAD